MNNLERTLAQLGRELDYPETPELGPAVRARLSQAPPVRAAWRRRLGPSPQRLLSPGGRRQAVALALVLLLILASATFAAVPSLRDAVLELVGLRGATVERRTNLPAPPELRPLRLGDRIPPEDAGAAVGFTPLIPRDLPAPDAAFVRRDLPGGELSLTYGPTDDLPEARATGLGLLVSEFRGDLLPEYAGKLAGPDTRIDRLQVEGNQAIWVEGAQHFFFYRPSAGADVEERDLRIAANALLLQRGDLLVRLEGAFDRTRALQIARSLGR